MTPITDHKTPRRLAEMTPRQKFFSLLELGLSEDAAEKISGWNEQAEVKAAMRSWSLWALAIGAVALGVFLAMSPARADEEDNTEAWFAACLGGAAVQVGDRVFRRMDVGGAQ